MKFKEIAEQGPLELELLETKLRKELGELWLKVRLGQLPGTAQIGNTRRDIARVVTARKMKGKV